MKCEKISSYDIALGNAYNVLTPPHPLSSLDVFIYVCYFHREDRFVATLFDNILRSNAPNMRIYTRVRRKK